MLESAIDFTRSARSRREGKARLAVFVDQIRAEFPNIDFTRAKLIDIGFDHAVVVLDEDWVFRFPRTEYYKTSFSCEIRLLQALRLNTTVAAPNYSCIAANAAFGGYPMIKGRELDPSVFRTLDRTTQEAVLNQVANMLSGLHSLSPDLIARPDGDIPNLRNDRRFTDGYLSDRRPILAKAVDSELLSAIDRFILHRIRQNQFQLV